MIEYPANLPCPLRAQYLTDIAMPMVQTPMQGGYIVARRLEPRIYRQKALTYRMSIDELHSWWDWTQRYGFTWHTAVLQGTQTQMRYISDPKFDYVDFATVTVSVRAELDVPTDPELWDEGANGAPTLYTPPVNAADPGDSTAGASLDLDFKTAFEPLDLTLASASEDLTFGTSQSVGAVSSILLVADGAVRMEIFENTTQLASTVDNFLRWHHDAQGNNSLLALAPGTAYTLRLTGTVGESIRLWGYTQ